MKLRYALFAAAVVMAVPVATANPFEQMKGKMKEGLYETKMEMEMPGMPQGMGKQTHQHCVTQKDIDSGEAGKGGPMSKGPQDCEVKDFKMSGNTATYKVACKGANATTIDTKMTFTGNGYQVENKMVMNQGGQVMNVTQKMDSKYIGPCKK